MTQSHYSLPKEYFPTGCSVDVPVEHSVDCDLTTFPSSDAFAALCDRHRLTETDTTTSQACNSSDSEYYHWYNDNTLLTTCCHPVTGRMYRSGSLEFRDPGYASHLMLNGTTDTVVPLYKDLVETATHIKGGDVVEHRLTADGTYTQCDDRFPDRLQQFIQNERQAFSQPVEQS